MIKVGDLEVYDVQECAKLLNVHPQTVRSYVRKGLLRGQKVGGKQYVTADTIKEFLRGGTGQRERL